MNLRALLEALRSGERITDAERSAVAQEALQALGLEETLKLLTRNQSYGRVLQIAAAWSELLGVDRKTFLLAWRGRAPKDVERAP